MKQLFEKLSPQEREAALSDNAARIEKDFSFVHTLSDEELNSVKDDFVELLNDNQRVIMAYKNGRVFNHTKAIK